MNWQDVCGDPALRDLPYKIELDEWGRIVMRPLTNLRGIIMGKACDRFHDGRSKGLPMLSCPIATAKGVRVADVAWASRGFLKLHAGEDVFSQAPELCVEIMSPPGHAGEWSEKRNLYFGCGAQEVWLCDERGNIDFHDSEGSMEKSRLFPNVTGIVLDDLPFLKPNGRGTKHDH